VLNQRYDLSGRPIPGVMMSGGPQGGSRRGVRQACGRRDLGYAGVNGSGRGFATVCRWGSCHCRISNHATSSQVFGNVEIDEIRAQEGRNLRRFDIDFDLPDTLTPEFPPPIFLTALVQNSRHEQKTLPFSPWRPQAPSTAFPDLRRSLALNARRPGPNCLLRMRCSSSMPAIVIAAFLNSLKPSITAMRLLHTAMVPARSSCSGISTSVAWLFAGSEHRLSAHAPHGAMRRSRPA